MAEFPAYAKVRFHDYSETFDPSIERTEMERGVPKQRVINSQVLAKISASILFRSAADVASFESWYFDVIKRIGWFTMTHPRTGQVINARFENADIGVVSPLSGAFRVAKRDVVIEYLR